MSKAKGVPCIPASTKCQYFILLRQDMEELDNWVEEGLSGAVELAARIRAKLKGIV